jgi:hypothetical protein
MLIWINGPFGGGKTATAYELQRRLADSVVCDPEHIGFGLHRTLPPQLRSDFQDLSSWRQGVHEVLDLAAREHPGPVLVPMTLTNPQYFAETVGRLREDGHDVRHFCLLADRATVLRRLNKRGFGFGLKHEQWAVDRLDDCLTRLRGVAFATHIQTDGVSVSKVADTIAHQAGLRIAPDTDSSLRTQWRLYRTSVRHMRAD